MIKLIKMKQSDSVISTQTQGLSLSGYPEIRVDIFDPALGEEADAFLEYISHWILASKTQIRPGETMAYGYWLVKFKSEDEGVLETWEYLPDASNFSKGADLTLNYWRDQHRICEHHKAEFMPPRPDRLTVISDGVLEGLPVQAVRYPSPDHMSGWWITTDLYNGDIQTLRHEHTYHVTAARPDLAKYLALPDGFRFDLSMMEDVWLDEKVRSRAT